MGDTTECSICTVVEEQHKEGWNKNNSVEERVIALPTKPPNDDEEPKDEDEEEDVP